MKVGRHPPKSMRPTSMLNSLAVPLPDDASATEVAPPVESPKVLTTKEQLWQKARSEGGWFSFNTKYGALNPYAIYYGLTSIFLGLFWYAALTGIHFLYFITGGRIDKMKRMPVFVSQIWGESLLFAVRGRPIFSGREKLNEFYKTNQAAMFVANHNSWLDIPFIGAAIGWRNYKLVSKAELGRVPILGKAIRIGGHLLLDRADRKSQLMTLRQGMDLLKDGVHLCTFPEGTRSKDGHLGPFKNGAFKMAHKVGAPVIPVSIVGAGAAMPYYWMFPFRAPRSVPVKVVIHDPISSIDKTEDELAQQVRAAVIAGLPEEQRPLSNE